MFIYFSNFFSLVETQVLTQVLTMQSASDQVPPVSKAAQDAAAIAASVNLDANTLSKRIRTIENQHMKNTDKAIAKRQARASGSAENTAENSSADNTSTQDTSTQDTSAELIARLFSEE